MKNNEALDISKKLIDAFKAGNKVLIFGCGGLAAEASHFAGELVCKYKHERRALPAIALTVDPSIITAISNDYGFKFVFSRQIEALGKPGDVAIALSTSGKSQSVLNGIQKATELGLTVIDWPREGEETGYIQEGQLCLIHEVCGLVEEAFI